MTSQLEKLQRDACEQFDKLAESMAGGEEFTDEQIKEICVLSHKTFRELQDKIEDFREVISGRELITEAKELEAQAKQLDEQFAETDEPLQKLQDELASVQARIAPLAHQRDSLREQSRALRHQASSLRENANETIRKALDRHPTRPEIE